MSHPSYKNIGKIEIRVMEECSELIKEICKSDRFGYRNSKPGSSSPSDVNINRVLSELTDVINVCDEYRKWLLNPENFDE